MRTNSLAFPRMFDVARNRVGVIEDNISIVSRSRLLILTEPTELYDNPDFGVGLRRHLWQYKKDNEIAIIKDRIVAQLEKHEPCVNADKTTFAKGLLFTGGEVDHDSREHDKLKMTVGLRTIYNDQVEVELEVDVNGNEIE